MSILIHVGYPKTATTWFQNQLFPLIENYHIIDKELIKEKVIYQNMISVNDFNIQHSKNVLISVEALVGSLLTGNAHGIFTKEIASRLADLFPDAKIILFIRNQPDMIVSSYLQYIRMGGTYNCHKFLFQRKNLTHYHSIYQFALDMLKYDAVIELYTGLFGKSNIYIYLYEDFNENPVQFVSDFIATFDISVDSGKINYQRKKAGYNKTAIFFARGINRFTHKYVMNKHYFMHLPLAYEAGRSAAGFINRFDFLGRVRNPVQILGQKKYAYICDYYKESNQNLINKYHLHAVEKYNYPC